MSGIAWLWSTTSDDYDRCFATHLLFLYRSFTRLTQIHISHWKCSPPLLPLLSPAHSTNSRNGRFARYVRARWCYYQFNLRNLAIAGATGLCLLVSDLSFTWRRNFSLIPWSFLGTTTIEWSTMTIIAWAGERYLCKRIPKEEIRSSLGL